MTGPRENAMKDASDRYAQYYGDVRKHLVGEFSAEIRWLTASLFALNAGGLAALSNRSELSNIQRLAGFGFWLGIFFAFSYIYYSQIKTKKFVGIIQKTEELYVLAAATGQLDRSAIAALDSERKSVGTTLAPFLSAGSFVAFSIALIMFSWCQ